MDSKIEHVKMYRMLFKVIIPVDVTEDQSITDGRRLLNILSEPFEDEERYEVAHAIKSGELVGISEIK